jgi:hypothetical protein
MNPLVMKSFYRRLQMQGPSKPKYRKETKVLYKAPRNLTKGKIMMADSDQTKEIELKVHGMT